MAQFSHPSRSNLRSWKPTMITSSFSVFWSQPGWWFPYIYIYTMENKLHVPNHQPKKNYFKSCHHLSLMKWSRHVLAQKSPCFVLFSYPDHPGSIAKTPSRRIAKCWHWNLYPGGRLYSGHDGRVWKSCSRVARIAASSRSHFSSSKKGNNIEANLSKMVINMVKDGDINGDIAVWTDTSMWVIWSRPGLYNQRLPMVSD